MNRLFERGDRVFNTGNRTRKTIGIITRVIDGEYAEVLWSDGEGYATTGMIRRDGTVPPTAWDSNDRIVRVKLSVTIPQEV